MNNLSQLHLVFEQQNTLSDNVQSCLRSIQMASSCFHRNAYKIFIGETSGHRSKPEKILDLLSPQSLKYLSSDERAELDSAVSERQRDFLKSCGIGLDGSLETPAPFSRLGRAVNSEYRNRLEIRERSMERQMRPEPEATNREKPEHAIEFIKAAMYRYRSLEGQWLPKQETVSKIGRYIFRADIHKMDSMDIDHLKLYLREDEKTMLGNTGLVGFEDFRSEKPSSLDRKIADEYFQRVENYAASLVRMEKREQEKAKQVEQAEAQAMPLFHAKL